MGQNVIYARKESFMGRLAILTCREHLCGYFEERHVCVESGVQVDPQTGHTVCLGCYRITVASGLRECDICCKEYIDKGKYQDPRYETNCPVCVKEFGLEND